MLNWAAVQRAGRGLSCPVIGFIALYLGHFVPEIADLCQFLMLSLLCRFISDQVLDCSHGEKAAGLGEGRRVAVGRELTCSFRKINPAQETQAVFIFTDTQFSFQRKDSV